MRIEADARERKRQRKLRGITYCSTAAIGTLAVVAAYQVGALAHVPDPSAAVFNSSSWKRSTSNAVSN